MNGGAKEREPSASPYESSTDRTVLNPGIPIMIRSDNPIKSYSSLHIFSLAGGGFDRPTSFFIRLLSPRTKFDLKTKTFKMTPRTKLSHEFEMTEEKCKGTFLHCIRQCRPTHHARVHEPYGVLLLSMHTKTYSWSDSQILRLHPYVHGRM